MNESAKRDESDATERGLSARLMSLISADQILSQGAYFALVPVLPLLLTMRLGDDNGLWAAWAIGALTLMTRGGSLFVAPVLHRMSVRTSLRYALGLIAIAYCVIAISESPLVLVAALGLAGLGFSANGTAVRSFVVLSTADRARQNRWFSVIQVVANSCAALGPILGSFVFDGGLYVQFLIGLSGVFVLAAVLVPFTVPRGVLLSQGSSRPPLKWGIVRELFKTPEARRITVIAICGSVLMGQFFSSFALVFSAVSDDPLTRALFYSLNGVLVVAIQLPVSFVIERLMRRGVSLLAILLGGVVVLGGAMILFIFEEGEFAVLLICIGVVIFSIGETVFTPVLNVVFSNASAGRPVLESMNMRQLTSAVGESLGSWAGLSVFLFLSDAGLAPAYWLLLTSLAGVAIAAFVVRPVRML